MKKLLILCAMSAIIGCSKTETPESFELYDRGKKVDISNATVNVYTTPNATSWVMQIQPRAAMSDTFAVQYFNEKMTILTKLITNPDRTKKIINDSLYGYTSSTNRTLNGELISKQGSRLMFRNYKF